MPCDLRCVPDLDGAAVSPKVATLVIGARATRAEAFADLRAGGAGARGASTLASGGESSGPLWRDAQAL